MSDAAHATPPRYDPDDRATQLLEGAGIGFVLSVLDSSPDCIKLIELDGRISYMNGNGLCVMEIDDFAMVDQKPWYALWPEPARPRLIKAVADATNGCVTRFEAFCPTARGTARWWHVTTAPIRDPQGRIERILAVSRDITGSVEQRRRLEAQASQLADEIAQKDAALSRQKVLLGEIDHRVKNSFAAVIGLLRIQARGHRGEPAERALVDAANRISTLARVHEQLHLDPGSGLISLRDYLGELACDIVGALGARLGQCRMPSEDVRVLPADATALGLILAELVGNAVKHGHGDGRSPVIDLTLELGKFDEHGQHMCLRVEDDGPGLPDGFDPEDGGLGMQICTIYAAQLGGGLRFGRSASGGALFELDIVLSSAEPGLV